MLMMVPLMIWSARTLMASQACTSEMSMPADERGSEPASSAGVRPKIAVGAPPRIGHERDTHHPADERGREHHALDADVHDARPLAEHAAQRGQGDRGRGPQDDGRR